MREYCQFPVCLGRLHVIVLCLFAGLVLSGCGNADTENLRKEAFKNILQKNILEKKGIRFPRLTQAQEKTLGPYAEHYKLLNFLSEDTALLQSFSGLPSLQQRLMKTMDPGEKKELIDEAGASMMDIKYKMLVAYTKLKDNKDSLVLPEDVQPLYDEAFLKVVQTPMELVLDLIDDSLAAVQSATDLNDYLLQHPGSARYRGATVVIEKAEAEKEIQRLFGDYKKKSDKALQTVRDLNNLTW